MHSAIQPKGERLFRAWHPRPDGRYQVSVSAIPPPSRVTNGASA
jgi:hypothetical protein